MTTLDLKITPGSEIYKGCHIYGREGRFFLAVSKDSGSVVIEANLRDWLEKIDRPDSEEITLTGQAPTWVYLIASAIVTPAFKAVHYDDGRGSIEIPSPPESE